MGYECNFMLTRSLLYKNKMLCFSLPPPAGSELINRVVSHPSQPVSITAHENRTIRYLDNKTGVCVVSLWQRSGP